MTPHWHRLPTPPWWPANEPWPPSDAVVHARRRRRSRFVRRFAIVFGLVLMLTGLGLGSLVSMIVSRFSMDAGSVPVRAVPVVVLLVLFFIVGLFVRGMRRVGSPLGDVVTAARRVGDGDFSVVLHEAGPPFLGQVAHAFNLMTSRLRTQDEERRQMMADIAHELRTPLSIVQGRLEGILDGVYERDDARLKEILEDTRVLGRLIEDLRTLANAESSALTLHREPVDLAGLAADVVAAFGQHAASAGVTVRLNARPDLPTIDVDPIRMREVLFNLVQNALQHTPATGTISIAIDRTDDGLQIRVADTGTGIAPEALPHVFERFYKGAGSRGSGLGLAIARTLVLAHGGELIATSEPGRSTTMTVMLPVGEPHGPASTER